jgi:hypothetical protein
MPENWKRQETRVMDKSLEKEVKHKPFDAQDYA